MKNLFSIDIGLVVDLGGLIGQAETSNPESTLDDISDGADTIGNSVDIDSITLPIVGTSLIALSQTAKAVEEATKQASEQGMLERLAFYIGPSINLGFIYFTAGACLGGFGCFAVGGGLRFGSFGIGVLIPIQKWW